MRVVTVNLPESHLTAISKLVGKSPNCVYPSRSEFVRTAVRNQLERDLKLYVRISNSGMIQKKKIKKVYKIFKNIRVPTEELMTNKELEECTSMSLNKLRELYPQIPDYKFIGEA